MGASVGCCWCECCGCATCDGHDRELSCARSCVGKCVCARARRAVVCECGKPASGRRSLRCRPSREATRGHEQSFPFFHARGKVPLRAVGVMVTSTIASVQADASRVHKVHEVHDDVHSDVLVPRLYPCAPMHLLALATHTHALTSRLRVGVDSSLAIWRVYLLVFAWSPPAARDR